MTEILTESFCERCGTRYTFEAVEAKRGPLGAIGTFGRGLRHFVSDPGSSLDESFAVARSEQEQRSTTHASRAWVVERCSCSERATANDSSRDEPGSLTKCLRPRPNVPMAPSGPRLASTASKV